MNRNPFYRYLPIFLVGVFALQSLAEGKVITPLEKDEKEILTISRKRRSYYQLHGNSLTYEIKGPKRIKIIARRAVPKREEEEKLFGYQLQLDSLSVVTIEHTESKSKGVTSSQHPGHGYTKAGHYFVTIPDGFHVLRIDPINKRSKPVLIRVIDKKSEIQQKSGTFIQPDSTEVYHLLLNEKRVRYSPLSSEKPITIHTNDINQLRIYSRLAFQNWMNGVDTYRLRILKGQDIVGTYFFSAERSEVSEIEEDKTVIPAKWRSCEIEVREENIPLTIELLDEGKTVYIRCVGYTKKNKQPADEK